MVDGMSEETSPAREGRDWTLATPVQRADEAARLAAIGWTYQDIADELGYANKGGAYKAAQRALVDEAEKRRQPNDLVRLSENQRMHMLIKRGMEIVARRHLLTNNNGVVYAPTSESEYLIDEKTGGILRDENGNPVVTQLRPLIDDAPALDAIKTVLKVMERYAKMNGLDAPTRRQIITLDGIEAQIAQLEEAMANRGSG